MNAVEYCSAQCTLHKEGKMTTKKTTELTENWTRTAKEMVTQSRKWAETARGMTLGPLQGMFASNDSI